MSAYLKDSIRTAKRNIRRLLAITTMVVLGVGINVGIPIACNSAYLSANDFYKEADMFDIRVVSTLGLTDDDILALSSIEGVENIFPCFLKKVKTDLGDKEISVVITIANESMLNSPYVISGRMPDKKGEVAVTSSFLQTSNKKLNDTILVNEKKPKEEEDSKTNKDETEDDSFKITVEEDETKDNLLVKELIIVGVVMSPMNTSISLNEGPESNEYLLYLHKDSLFYDIYTDIYMTISGVNNLDCYSKEYKDRVTEVIDNISANVKNEQMQMRYDSITGEAISKINDAKQELADKEADALKEISDAEIKILDGYDRIKGAEEEINDGWKEIYSNRRKLNNAVNEIEKGEAELNDARSQLDDGLKEYEKGKSQLDKEKKKMDRLQQGVEQIPSLIELLSQMVPNPPDEYTFNEIIAAISESSNGAAALMKLGGEQGAYAASNIEQINQNASNAMQAGYFDTAFNTISLLLNLQDAMEQTIMSAQKQIRDGLDKLKKAKKEIDKGFVSLYEGEAELASARQEIEDAKKKLYDGIKKLEDAEVELLEAKIELGDGERELLDNKQEFYKKTADAEELILEAEEKIADIPYPKWYILDRTSVDSFVRLDNDVSSIRAVCSVFPIIFLIVAVSVCLSSMTRLVEEERSIIGTLKALGYSNTAITLKYVSFAAVACTVGGILGGVLGSSFFPQALWKILLILHKFPNFSFRPNIAYSLFGTLVYAVSLVAATIYSCFRSLRTKPSELLRPKAPASGSRILLEQIKLLWNNLKFLGKVTARNLFRYKKRMFMTIFGVATCTALIVTGFALKNSAKNLVPKQFETVSTYDMIVVFDDEEDDYINIIERNLKDNDKVKDYLLSGLVEVTILNKEKESIGLQLISINTDKDYKGFFSLTEEFSNKEVAFTDDGIFITENAAKILEIKKSDKVIIRSSDNEEYEVRVDGVLHTYMGNSVYISSEFYRTLFGETKQNTFFIHNYEGVGNDERRVMRRQLQDIKHVLSVVNVDSVISSFNDSIQVVDSVVLLLIGFATCLAFVVLYTLANINISERKHEMATLKVLGFFNREIYQYVNRETIVLALFGVAFGLPAGYGIAEFIVATIRMPSISIHVDILPISYITAAVITLTFILVTNMFTNVVLKKLDMIEALKNME